MQNVISFCRLLAAHLRVHAVTYLLLPLLYLMFMANYRIGINETPSLPQTFFLIHKRAEVHKGDYVSFKIPPTTGPVKFNHNMILTKIVVGSPGDVVSVSGRVVRVNGVPVGFAKERSLKGEPLDPIQPSVVPPGHLYVMGLHKDSLDSRYTLVGLVPSQNVVGRAFPIL
jgi:conjugal transfer pilin signal peptidase TrbI